MEKEKIVNINRAAMRSAGVEEDKTFVACPCSPTAPAFAPVVQHHAGPPLLLCLLCIKCGMELRVSHGLVMVDG